MRRLPVRIKGFEAAGDYKVTPSLKLSALYSRIRGKTVYAEGGPLDREMGVLDINPDKFGANVIWHFWERSDLSVGSTTLFNRDINVGRSGEEHTRGYTLLDATVNYDLRKFGRLTLGVENVTNKQYILSWSQVVGFRNYWAGRGRVVSLTHTLTF